MQVFISYKSEYRPFAAQVRDQLRAWGLSTWFDQDDIPEGAYFRHEIQKGLESSDAVIGVMTQEAFQSREVMWEWDYALYNSRFVPVRYHDVPLPYHLQGQQYIDFVADVNAGFAQLRAALLNPSPPAPRPAPPPTSSVTIGRDAHGENVNIGGDQTIIQKQTIHYTFESPDNARLAGREKLAPQTKTEKSNRAVMLDKVYNSWIVGVLQTSVGDGGEFNISIQMAPNRVLKHRDYADYALPDTSADILRVFEDELRELLILGAPGAGKTILLLQLADALIQQARADDTQPIPVVFNLSSWAAERKPLEKWLADELRTKYQVPRKVATDYVEKEQLLLLLDGLDEVAEDHRNDCVAAINAYRTEYQYVDMVVCSRIADYEELTTRLNLTGAIAMQPLTPAEIADYLAGEEYAAVRAVMDRDNDLRQMAETPFLLNVIGSTYRGMRERQLDPLTGDDSVARLFDKFTEERIREGAHHSDYTPKDTRRYLTWLAQRMVEHEVTTFYIEDMQPGWLASVRQIRIYKWIFGLSVGWSFGLISGLIVGVICWALFGLVLGLVLGMLSGMVFGLLYGLLFGLLYSMGNSIILKGRLFVSREALIFGLGVGLSVGVISGLIGVLLYGLLIGLSVGVIFGLIGGLPGGLYGVWRSERSNELSVEHRSFPNVGVYKSSKNGGYGWLLVGGIVGLSVGVISGLIVGMISGLSVGVISGLSVGVISGLIGGLPGGLISGLDVVIQHAVLRRLLQRQDALPPARGPHRFFWLGNYAAFLDHCASIGILRKVGGGYIFRHRYLLEYFAAQELK